MVITIKRSLFGAENSVLVAGKNVDGKMVGMALPAEIADTCKIGQNINVIKQFTLPDEVLNGILKG